MSTNTKVAVLGFPRIGPRRELKVALEKFWAGTIDENELISIARSLRATNWTNLRDMGADFIPSNDFSFYDHVLDTIVMTGAVPAVYRNQCNDPSTSLQTYFGVARGVRTPTEAHPEGIPAAEMTKWFDTNYHYIVPEFTEDQSFKLSSTKALDEYLEAQTLGIETRPVLLGPVSFLLLGKPKASEPAFDPLTLLPRLLAVYCELLSSLARAGVEWVQIDEPCLVLDISDVARHAFATAYQTLTGSVVPSVKLMLTTYFGPLGDNLDLAVTLPVHGLHVDLIRGPEQLSAVLARLRSDVVLSLGVVNGRNIWKADLNEILEVVEPVVQSGRTVILAPSCSLLHTPVDLSLETALDAEITNWLSFAVQKVAELKMIARALNEGRDAVCEILDASAAAVASRKSSSRIHNPAVKALLQECDVRQLTRASPFAVRKQKQRAKLNLPLFPTTMIGSLPQTPEIRKARAEFDKGSTSESAYRSFLQAETALAVNWQEELGLDVLVHGEYERNDMVQYFGEQLAGFAFTKYGWVQSYGSRCVRPPIIFGDVSRPQPMTVDWWAFAQSLTSRPMKGMLTGPVTILNWSFVRDDQPRSETCRQIAFAIRSEVLDLESAGAAVIQIDEAALREGLPLRRSDWQQYLDWAVESFKITAGGVFDETQIHTHMCYSEFNHIIAAIGALDADVISIETARSQMELLEAFASYRYPNEVGPGVYDIHSPRVPSRDDMVQLLRAACQHVPVDQLWVNPDCGLKTRKWPEVKPAIASMIAAAIELRAEHPSSV